MQNTHVRAIYQHGAFRPLEDVSKQFTEGQKVDLLVRESNGGSTQSGLPLSEEAQQTLALLTNFYSGLTDAEIEEIEQNLRRGLTFTQRDIIPDTNQE